MLTIDESGDGRSVALRVGEDLRIRLPENRTTGFRWGLAAADGSCVLADEGFEPPGPEPGQAGAHWWRFRAERVGRGRIELASHRPWEDASKTARRFTVEVDVSA